MAGLEIQVGANIKDFQNKIKEVENDVQQLANEKAIQIKLGLDTKEITSQIRDAKKHLNDLKQTVKDTGGSFSGMAPKVANGSNALTQFNRIVQDAPFGAMGVQNNLTAFGEAFGYLVNQTGSAKAAFGAMVGSLVGSGGVMLAISAVTSGLTYMSQNGLSVGDVLDQLSGNFDNLKKAMQDVNNEAIKNSGAEIASMKALVSIAKDENATRQERLAAVQKLQKEYPAYFGNLSEEQILSGKVEQAVKAVTFALIQKAKAQVIANRIAENDLKILQKQQEGQKLVADYTAGKGLYAVLKGANGMRVFKTSADSVAKAVDTLKKEQELLTKELENSTRAANTFEIANTKASKTPKKTKAPNVTPQVQGIDVAITQTGLDGLVSLSGMVTQVAKNVQGAEGVIKTSMGNIPGYFDTSGQESLKKLQDFNKQLSQIVTSGTVNAVSGIGEAIGSALANGGSIIDAVGKSLLSSIGSLLVDLGKATIAYGVGLLAIQTAIKNPYTAIAAGAALVIVGSAISSAVSKTASGMPGGNTNTGGNYNSPGSSVSYGNSGGSSGFGGGTVVFEISGTSLIGVLSNSLDRNSRLGGALGI